MNWKVNLPRLLYEEDSISATQYIDFIKQRLDRMKKINKKKGLDL